MDVTRAWRVAPDQMKDKHQAVLASVIYQVAVARIEAIDAIAPCQLLRCRSQVLCAKNKEREKYGLRGH